MGRKFLNLHSKKAVSGGVLMMTNRDRLKFNNKGGGYIDPVPDYLFKYKLDGNDANLTPINTPNIVAGIALPDKLASDFNGVDQYYDASPDSATVAIGSGAFSWAFWVRFSSSSANDPFGNGNGETTDVFRFRCTSGGLIRLRTNRSNRSASGTLNDGQWHHITYTSTGSGGDMEIYVDSASNSSPSSPIYDILDSSAFTVGRAPTNNNFWNGNLDDIRLYDRVLSPSEVTAIYNNKA